MITKKFSKKEKKKEKLAKSMWNQRKEFGTDKTVKENKSEFFKDAKKKMVLKFLPENCLNK